MKRHATPAPKRALPWLIAGVAAVAAVTLSLPWRWLTAAENITIDFRYQARGPVAGDSRSVIVGIADSSFTIAERAPSVVEREPLLARMSGSWPWDRRVFAGLVRRLRASGARAIVFDVVFATENAGDDELARAFAEPGAPVVLASWLEHTQSAVGENTVTLLEAREPLLAANGGRTGYANVWPDDDGVLRRLTTELRPGELFGDHPTATTGLPVPSLAFAAAKELWPATVPKMKPGFIDYRGPAGALPIVPIEDVFLADRWNGPFLQAGRLFRDRVVWIGPLSEIRFKDYFGTPLGRMPGVEAQAHAFETLVRGVPLTAPGRPITIALVWLLAASGAAATTVCRRVPLQLVLVVGGGAAWAALALILFPSSVSMLPVVAPLGAWLIAGAGGVGARFIAEQQERRRVRGLLARYVSEEVAQVILAQPEEFTRSLLGRRCPVAVLFADLRGFTSWVEAAEPEALVAQLNEYFHAIVDCVLAHGGTLQKFIGDAVLAVWGDTRSAGASADAAHALDATLAIQAAVSRLNTGWAVRRDRTAVAIGIGLHHGPAMVGNIGHPRRMEFTVLGDAVNVAARLETANRQLGTTVLASAAIRDLTADTHRHADLGKFVLKGRREPVRIFVPLGRVSEPAPRWLASLEAAQLAWETGDFRAAAIAYTALVADATPLADFAALRAALAERHAAHPPADWRGEQTLELK